ncbi:uncharacterized protein MAM_05946 [Metarhizium album ARSEF 1941]|uniref:Uncharacterized protein n=1 Tax=Metarhizium album (strain ARSEF 1941) TaxID=1081103 RepID=A0A0B2WQ02_METAS|nr:uncharacterized protein MAM_05946 [Metarhizium album ARSEF 1941]KHN96098.1 hypothetical protein MAM_05946 [Metarhizium album ARSEF 1941]
MELTYESKDWYLPALATGGSISNLNRQQAVFLDDIECDDSETFARAVRNAHHTPAATPIGRSFKCGGSCETAEEGCAEQLRKIVSQAEEAAARVSKSWSRSPTGTEEKESAEPFAPQVLFPGTQHCGGCSRSPAWDAIELPSQWFARQQSRNTDTVTHVSTTNLSKLLDAPPAPGFVVVEHWVSTAVRKLPGTISHAASAAAWTLKRAEMQCMARAEKTEASAVQIYHPHTDGAGVEEGIFRYQGHVPILGCPQDELAHQMFSVGLLRNARVLSNVMCSVELYQTAAKLLEMRDATMASGLDTQVGGLRTSTRAASFPKLPLRGPLPPKLSGYATCPTEAYDALCDRERLKGGMRNTSLFAMALGYDRGVYGGSISGLWALMDSSFMFDYSTGSFNKHLAEKISNAFAVVRGHDTGNAELNEHLLDIVTVVGCNFTALKAKAALEDSRRHLRSRPCVAIWDDLAALARYRLADAVFCHVWYDCPGDEASLAMVGTGCAVHDLIDIGPDISCGEISNMIPSLTGGHLSLGAMWRVYVGVIAAVEWYAEHDAFNTGALAILFTHWWQLDNLRHRTVALMSRVAPSPEHAVCPEPLFSAPSFSTFTSQNGLKYETGQPVMDSQRAELDRIEAAGFQDVQGVVGRLVRPVLDFADGKDSRLPVEATYCADVLEACLSRKHSQKIRLMWRLMLVMWKCGAMWNVVLASTQYAHHGLTNCDRGRDDYTEATWSHASEHAGSKASPKTGEPRPRALQRALSKICQLLPL